MRFFRQLSKNFHLLIAGIGLLWVGTSFLKTGRSYLYDQPVPPVAGYICITAGIFVIYRSFSAKK
jgi:hypothetical protein